MVNIGSSTVSRLRSSGFGKMVADFSCSATPTVIHLHGFGSDSSHEVVRSAVNSELPLIVTPRGMLEDWALNHNKLKKRLAWALFQRRDLHRATAFHATALSESQSIRRLGFKQPIAIIPNGVELSSMTGMNQGVSQCASTRVKTALFLSRINPKKGLLMLLEAWKRVKPEGWRLVIAGNDDSNHLPIVERKMKELGLMGKVEFAGPLFGDARCMHTEMQTCLFCLLFLRTLG